mgnify:CR=1 FL=1
MIPLVDAHAHLGGERERQARAEILTVLCGTEPVSAARVLELQDNFTLASCALHPWNVEKNTVEEMLPFIEACPILGEIGLDSVWTDADMTLQRAALNKQLELAQALNKPIVLHTKGMEQEIARTIRPYSVRKLVHWYSCMDFLEDYLSQDCYFTIGPDHDQNPAVAQVLSRAPLNRLMTETDGMSAVNWARGREVDPAQVGDVLEGELKAIAQAKGVALRAAREAVYQNLLRFIHGA